MADFTVTITVPDEKVADLQDALKDAFGQIEENGEFRDRTPAELKDAFAGLVRSKLARFYREHTRRNTSADLGETA